MVLEEVIAATATSAHGVSLTILAEQEQRRTGRTIPRNGHDPRLVALVVSTSLEVKTNIIDEAT